MLLTASVEKNYRLLAAPNNFAALRLTSWVSVGAWLDDDDSSTKVEKEQ